MVYILTNQHYSVLYVGVTSDLVGQMRQHITKISPGTFAARYHVRQLVYFRLFDHIEDAIGEEKRIKAGSRAKKIALIHSFNPQWKDLWINEVSKW